MARSLRTPEAIRCLVAGEVADLDSAQDRTGRRPGGRIAQARIAGDRSRAVLGQDPKLVPAPEHRMAGDDLAAVTNDTCERFHTVRLCPESFTLSDQCNLGLGYYATGSVNMTPAQKVVVPQRHGLEARSCPHIY